MTFNHIFYSLNIQLQFDMYKENLTTIFTDTLLNFTRQKRFLQRSESDVITQTCIILVGESGFKPGLNFSAVNRLISHLMHMFFCTNYFL